MPERAGQDSQDAEFAAARRKLTADRGIDAADLPAALSDLTDRWLADLFSRAAPAFAVDHQPERTHDGVALVAVGGYGRSELCPRSDIDLLLAHDPQLDTGGLADRIWYPVWDQGLKLGHAVRTVEECIELAAGDVDTSTALLDARHVAGDPRLTVELRDRIRRHWSDNPAQCLADLLASTDRRHRLNGEVAFLLEPNLKLGRGGLRDVHTARWAAAAGITPTDDDRARLDVAHRTLLRARVALHLLTGRASDVLPTEEQQPAAELLGVADSDTLMYDIAGAARDIAYISSHLWRARRSGVEGAAADAAP
ncbi:MAG TPA: hypothetical protein DEP66_07460, partial [Acidimicrobiaceae bacterium]|nr:hypothetical protein [Acidimicrobiaceae bacterium]